MNINKINYQPEFRGKILLKTFRDVIDAKAITKIDCNEGDRFTTLVLDFTKDGNSQYRKITIGDRNSEHDSSKDNYMKFLQIYSIALQAPDDATIAYYV